MYHWYSLPSGSTGFGYIVHPALLVLLAFLLCQTSCGKPVCDKATSTTNSARSISSCYSVSFVHSDPVRCLVVLLQHEDRHKELLV